MFNRIAKLSPTRLHNEREEYETEKMLTIGKAVFDSLMERVPGELQKALADHGADARIVMTKAIAGLTADLPAMIDKAIAERLPEFERKLAEIEDRFIERVASLNSDFLSRVQGIRDAIESMHPPEIHVAAPPTPAPEVQVLIPPDTIQVKVDAVVQQPARTTTVEKSILYDEHGRPRTIVEETKER